MVRSSGSQRSTTVVRLVLLMVMVAGMVSVSTTAEAAPYPSRPTTTVAPKGSRGFPFLSDATYAAGQGYREDEYLLAGTATSYDPVGDQGTDGNWTVKPAKKAGYRTRLLVRRPVDPARFNGTVIVEWFNISGTIDIGTDWGYGRDQMMRDGYAYVGVSAQQLSVETGTAYPGLKTWDPQRYGTLHHPGDEYSYDIYSQVAQALRSPDGASPLGGLAPKALVAMGESQSAMRLSTYVNAIAPRQHLYDGYLLHSNGIAAAGLGGIPFGTPSAKLRTNLGEPVLVLKTETDVSFDPKSLQPDSAGVKTWQVAGTAHADKALLDDSLALMRRMYGGGLPDIESLCRQTGSGINDGPSGQAVDAAITAVQHWVRDGRTPPTGTPFQLTTEGKIVRDPATGLARGGIRLPDVAVPTRTLSGQRSPSDPTGPVCGLFGAADPWNGDSDAWDKHDASDPSDPAGSGVREPSLTALYPTHADYVAKVRAAAAASASARFLTPADASEVVAAAQAAPVPGS